MPKKFIRCVREVTKKNRKLPKSKRVNPYAVCRKSTGYYGTTHDIGMIHKKKK